jgi:hypothetical protein
MQQQLDWHLQGSSLQAVPNITAAVYVQYDPLRQPLLRVAQTAEQSVISKHTRMAQIGTHRLHPTTLVAVSGEPCCKTPQLLPASSACACYSTTVNLSPKHQAASPTEASAGPLGPSTSTQIKLTGDCNSRSTPFVRRQQHDLADNVQTQSYIFDQHAAV